jgi:hypothetical protein
MVRGFIPGRPNSLLFFIPGFPGIKHAKFPGIAYFGNNHFFLRGHTCNTGRGFACYNKML